MLTDNFYTDYIGSNFLLCSDLTESKTTMSKAVVALFDDIAIARQVIEDLVNADYARSSIRLITNDANNSYQHYLDKAYTPRDDAVTALEGAIFGAVVGILMSILVALAVSIIPGIELTLLAGPILAGLIGGVSGAVIGSIVGVLIKSRVPDNNAVYYAEGIRRGGTLISVQTSDTLRAKDIMNRHGATNIHERINLWRQDGFDAKVGENNDIVKSPPAMVTPIASHNSPSTVEALVEIEPQINEEDTVKSLPVISTTPPSDTNTSVLPTPNMVDTEPSISTGGERTKRDEAVE